MGEPPAFDKYVLIGAPHTSNWDFVLLMLVALSKGVDAHWMGKDSLFPLPFRGTMMWLGGIPIDRSRNHNTVDQVVEYYRSTSSLVVVITPEGTRSRVERWRSGFYHVAYKSAVPIVLGYVDGENRQVGFGPVIEPSGDYDEDIKAILAFYAPLKGLNPDQGL